MIIKNINSTQNKHSFIGESFEHSLVEGTFIFKKMEKISCIYQIKSKINSKIYIGSAVDFYKRKILHLHCFKKNKHPNKILQNHANKYGIEDLQFSFIEFVMFKDELIKKEQYYIDKLKPHFNICKVAGSCLGRKMTDEHKEKIGNANKNKLLGYKHTEEAKKNMSNAMIGINTWQKGKKHTEDTKLKMRKSAHRGGENHKSKRVINIKTNEVYTSITEASKTINMKMQTLSAILRGVNKNKTDLRFII